jgi:hypothetical protein
MYNSFKEYIISIHEKYKDKFLLHLQKTNKFLNVFEKDNLILINFLNNNDLNRFCLFNKDLNIFLLEKYEITLYKNDFFTINKNWNNINIYENIGDKIYFFKHENQIYIIYKFEQNYKISNITEINYINELYKNSNIELNNNIFKKMLLVSNKYNKLLYYKNNVIYESLIDYNEKKKYFSCSDELLFELEKISQYNENKKKLSINGYILEYENNEYIINTNLYQKIIDMMPKYNNINKCYIELYKDDNLSFLVNYMTSYTHEIINRINISIKTLCKEILNIYHLTRKKNNKDLYNLLSNNYKNILFDLHNIFIYCKNTDNNLKSFEDSDDIDIDLNKLTINIDVIYKYLKKINTDLLINIFIDRENLIKNIKNININYDNFNSTPTQFKIILNDCSYTKTLSILLNY